jgi:hypothetical protein
MRRLIHRHLSQRPFEQRVALILFIGFLLILAVSVFRGTFLLRP